MEQISKKLAANDKVIILKQKMNLYFLFGGLSLGFIISSFLGLQNYWFLIILIMLGYWYKTDEQEIKRMVNTYGL